MTPEARVKKKIVDYLKKVEDLKFFCVQDRYTAGIPDILVCYRGYFFAFEVKAPTGKLSVIQRITLDEIKEAGGKAVAVRSVDDVKNILLGGNYV